VQRPGAADTVRRTIDQQVCVTGRLQPNVRLFGVFSVSLGAMIGSGIFVLPGIAAKLAGPAVVVAYVIAGIVVLPAALSQSEMATAMPEAGGTYLYIDRAMGPLMGTIAGFGVWFSLIFKSAFALDGLGAYLEIFAEVSTHVVAISLAVAIIVLNLIGVKQAARFQVILVTGVLASLAVFTVRGLGAAQPHAFEPFLDGGFKGLLSASGLVFVSYLGVTKVASIAEEVDRPARNIPLGILLSIGLMIVVYPAVVYVMVGVAGVPALAGTFTPVATAAEQFMGTVGVDVLTVIAMVALVSMANAGLLASSRYPFAMARRDLAPAIFRNVGARSGTPYPAVILTGAVLVGLVWFVPLVELAKLASAFQLLVFSLVNLAVVAFRESRLDWYQPSFRSPGYPWVQLFGIFGALVLLTQMGIVPALGAVAIIVTGFLWYRAFGRSRASRESASLDALRLRSNARLLRTTENVLANPGAAHVLVLTWHGMRRERLHDILKLAGDLAKARTGWIQVSRLDRRGPQSAQAEQAWTAEIMATAAKVGVTLHAVSSGGIREDQQRRIRDEGVDLVLAEMPQDLRANRPFVRDLRWLRDNIDSDTIFLRNRNFHEIDTIVVMGTGGPFDALKIGLADRMAHLEQAEIRLVHVVNEDATEAQVASIRDYQERLAERITAPTESRLERAEALVDTLAGAARGASLVILGAVPQRFTIFTDLADRIAERMDCPTMLVYAKGTQRRSLLGRLVERLIY
jgi:amino acid transporter